MKTITSYLLGFIVSVIILTILFRFFLSYSLANKEITVQVLSCVVYFIGMFSSGWYFGKKDGNYLPIYDVGFRFHLSTYLVFNLISELWYIFEFNSSYEKIKYIHLTAIIWGIFVLIHFFYYLWSRKQTIDNLEKSELFE